MDMACVDEDDEGLGFYRKLRKRIGSRSGLVRQRPARIYRGKKIIRKFPMFGRPVKRPAKANQFVCKMVRRF